MIGMIVLKWRQRSRGAKDSGTDYKRQIWFQRKSKGFKKEIRTWSFSFLLRPTHLCQKQKYNVSLKRQKKNRRKEEKNGHLHCSGYMLMLGRKNAKERSATPRLGKEIWIHLSFPFHAIQKHRHNQSFGSILGPFFRCKLKYVFYISNKDKHLFSEFRRRNTGKSPKMSEVRSNSDHHLIWSIDIRSLERRLEWQ